MPIPFYRRKPAPAAAFAGVDLPQNSANVFSRAIFQWISPILQVGYSRPIQADDLWNLTEDLQCQTNADQLEARFMQRLPPSRRAGNFKSTTAQAPTQSSPSTIAEKDSQSSSTIGDGAKEGDPTSKEVPDVSREEAAVVNTIEDLTAVGDIQAEGTASAFPRPSSTAQTTSGLHGSTEPSLVKRLGKKKSRKIAAGQLVVEDGKEYDMSLTWAIYWTHWFKWWKAVILNISASVLQITAPLITRKIIEQMTLANTYHKIESAGGSTVGVTLPKSVGYGIGLAIALFVMEMASSLFKYQAQQRGAVLGFLARASLIDLISRKSMRLSGKARIEMTNGRLTTMVSADASFLDFAAPMTLDLVAQPVQIVIGMALLIYTLGYSALVGLLVSFPVFDTSDPVQVLILATPLQGFMFVQMITYRQQQMKIVDTRVRLLSEIINNIRAVKLYAYEVFFGEKVSSLRRQELAKLRRNGLNRSTMNATMSFIPILAAVLTFITYGLSGHSLNVATIFSGLQYFNVMRQPITFLPLAFTAVSDAVVAIGRIGVMLRSEELKHGIQIDAEQALAVDVVGDFQFDSTPRSDTGPRSFGRDRAGAKEAKKKAKKDKEAAKTRRNNGEPEVEKPKMEEGVPFSLRDVSLKISRGSLVCILGRVGTGKTALLSGMINEMKQTKGHVRFGGPVGYVPQHAWVQSGTIRENISFSSKPEDVDIDRVNEIIDACALRPEVDMWPEGDLILVTHQLDVLPYADLVLVLDRGDDNVGRIIQQGTFSQLREEEGVFRTLMQDFGSSSAKVEAVVDAAEDEPVAKKTAATGGGKLILDEERETGAVSWRVYGNYAKAMGSWPAVCLCFTFLILTQAATVGNTLFLGFWSGDEIAGFSQGAYMGVYAALGVIVAVFTWLASYSLVLAGLRASFSLFAGAWKGVLRSPTGWHDRTPTGRIISRLSKDIEMLDDRLAQVWNQLFSNGLSVVGTFALVIYSFPYLGLAFIPFGIFFYIAGSYYRQTSREVKRVDSLLRSFIYNSFGEQLSGLAVIRAFGQQTNFEKKLQRTVNAECEAYIVTITIQRSAGSTIESYEHELIVPRWLGLRLDFLSYLLVMNNVERVQYYNDLEKEAAPLLPTDPGPEWPEAGVVEFSGVKLRYRPDLPLVLDGLDFTLNAGEKVGIVGRTGAGKSSIAQALFRTVELHEGKIIVDGRNLRDIGLDTVNNIDPTGARSDAELAAALNLVHANAGKSNSFKEKFRLDATVLNEGSNFSAGERQLPTSSVDPETDAVIQKIIQTEFSDVTLISIAHRLQTVAYYDRILVMDAGKIAEVRSRESKLC
ncbi:hypothetical protein P7C73_g3435, partial [Tremellales sp. Uapishka_1]